MIQSSTHLLALALKAEALTADWSIVAAHFECSLSFALKILNLVNYPIPIFGYAKIQRMHD